MTTRMFNGSTLTIGSTSVSRLVGMQYKIGGNTIDVTEPDDLNKLFEVGQDDLELTAKVKRMPTATRGTKDTLAVTWADGSTTTLPGTWIVTAVDGGGDWDSPIAGNISFKPTVPDA